MLETLARMPAKTCVSRQKLASVLSQTIESYFAASLIHWVDERTSN